MEGTQKPFKLLRVFSVLFKVLAWLTLLLMAVGVVGALMGAEGGTDWTVPVILNMGMSGLLGFIVLYALGEIIRVLLIIEANTRTP